MSDDMGSKTEAPTGRRLAEARSTGNVARSQDLASAIDMFGAFILTTIFGASMARSMYLVLRSSLEDQQTPQASALPELLRANVVQLGMSALPFLGLACVIAGLAQVSQFGLLWNVGALTPKFDRLNPMNGLGKFFGRRSMAKTVVNTGKLIIVCLICWNYARNNASILISLPGLTALGAWAMIAKLAARLAIWLFSILLLMGAADYLYQRWQHNQDLKMTKDEVKDERRSMEGDPQIKGKRFRMAREIIRQRIASAVPQSNVVIVNPTHFSVALRYDPETMPAPRVVAKGADELAMSIRHIAKANGIPIVERPPLARALYRHCEVGKEINPQYFEAVAEVLAYVYRLEKETAAANKPLVPVSASPASGMAAA
jgi:flagellar biosynthetic protein FlhB